MQDGYVFRRRNRDKALLRFKTTREFERLEDLRDHVKEYMIEDLARPVADGIGLWGRIWRRGILRWVVAPLPGGAERKPRSELLAQWQQRRATELLESRGAHEGNLPQLAEQALAGQRQMADRCAVLEQRANYFLAAAGLASTLVLANAGLLLSSHDKLKPPWIYVGAAALAAASICAVVGGLRAMQAAMTTCIRCTPSWAGEVENRANKSALFLLGNYVGALLVAQEREKTVGDWKLARLKSARRWFSASIVGVGLLTLCVLVDAIQTVAA